MPDPKLLEYYERICPGAAREIIEMAKVEQRARHSDVRAGRWLQFSGQLFGFVLSASGIIGGLYVVYAGRSLVGFSVFFTSLAALVIASVWENQRKHKKPAAEQPLRG